MDIPTYLTAARERIDAEGVHLQGVLPSTPFDPSYAYSVGLSERGHPELIAFACCIGCAGRLVDEASRIVLQGGSFVGGRVEPLVTATVRVEDVASVWVGPYAGVAAALLDRPPASVPMRQLVTPDAYGRWPEDRAVDPELLHDQPLLARAHWPWLLPVHRSPAEDLFPTDPACALTVAVPVYHGCTPEGRVELLGAEPVDGGRARLLDVPWRADHVGVGAVVDLVDGAAVPGLPVGTQLAGRIIDTGGQNRAYLLPSDDEPAGPAAPSGALWDLHASGEHRLSASPWTLHASSRDLVALDAALRPLVRDGLLTPIPLHSSSGSPTPVCGCVLCA
jgi:hypothetical protein